LSCATFRSQWTIYAELCERFERALRRIVDTCDDPAAQEIARDAIASY